VDAKAPIDTPIYAIADGVVKISDNQSFGGYGPDPNKEDLRYKGYIVIIEHILPNGSKIISLYGHVKKGEYSKETEEGLIPVGSRVYKGQYIASIEEYHGGNHLHFAIRKGAYGQNLLDRLVKGYSTYHRMIKAYIGLEYQNELTAGRISEVLRQELIQVGITISSNATISAVDGIWWIIDGIENYRVTIEEGRFGISELVWFEDIDIGIGEFCGGEKNLGGVWTDPVSFIKNRQADFVPLSFHNEQNDPRKSVYQFRKDGGLERLWPIFVGEVLFTFTGRPNDFSMVIPHLEGDLDRLPKGPTISKVGTLLKTENSPDVWLVTQANAQATNTTPLGAKRHVTGDAFRLAGFKWENVLTVEQSFLDRYDDTGELFTVDDIPGFYRDNTFEPEMVSIGLQEDRHVNIAFLYAYDRFYEDGFNKLGQPFDNYDGGIFVHKVENVWLQDFKQPDLAKAHFGDDGETALILNATGSAAYLVREGFWGWYKQHEGYGNMGPPKADENNEGPGGIPKQEFEKGYLLWPTGADDAEFHYDDSSLAASHNVTIIPRSTAKRALGENRILSFQSGIEIWHNGEFLGNTPLTTEGYEGFRYGMTAKLPGQPEIPFEFMVGNSDLTVEISTTPIAAIKVWPGDTNNDGKVGVADILPLGLYWRERGPARGQISWDWSEQTASTWNPRQATYADVNGDGVVEFSDLTSLVTNWGKTHLVSVAKPIALSQQGTGKLYITRETTEQRNMLVVHAQEIENLRGITFLVESSLSELLNLSTAEAGSIFGSDALFFSHFDKSNETLSIAVSLKGEQAPISGEGIVARIDFGSALSSEDALNITQARGYDSDGNMVMLQVEDLDIRILPADNSPQSFKLIQNYPNPFNASTIIAYTLPEPTRVRLTVYNVLGQPVRQLVSGQQAAGEYRLGWDGNDEYGREASSGIYLYKLETDKQVMVRRMVLLR